MRGQNINVKRHFVRDIVVRGTVVVVKIPTKDNLDGMITKVVTIGKFMDLINVQEYGSPLGQMKGHLFDKKKLRAKAEIF